MRGECHSSPHRRATGHSRNAQSESGACSKANASEESDADFDALKPGVTDISKRHFRGVFGCFDVSDRSAFETINTGVLCVFC